MKSDIVDDKMLIQALKEEKNWAFEMVYKLNYHIIENHILSNNGTKEECKDLFQDTVIGLIKSINKPEFKLNSSTKLSTFIFSIAKNQWLMKLKQKKQEEKYRNVSIKGSQSSLTEDGTNERTAVIMKALERIGDECKELLKQYYFNKTQLKVIAENMGYTEGFVRVKKNRCMNTLRKDVLQLSNANY